MKTLFSPKGPPSGAKRGGKNDEATTMWSFFGPLKVHDHVLTYKRKAVFWTVMPRALHAS